MTAPGSTLCAAVAALSDAERARWADVCRLNADASGRRGRRYQLALADTIDHPNSAAYEALRAAVDDLDDRARLKMADIYSEQRQVMAEEGREAMGDVYTEVMCLLLETSDQQCATINAVRDSMLPPCESPG